MEQMPFAQHMRCICSWWHWLLFAKSAISSFCIQLQDHELQQSELEVVKLTSQLPDFHKSRLKKKPSYKLFLPPLKTHGRMSKVSPWHRGFVQLKDFTSLLVQVQNQFLSWGALSALVGQLWLQAKPQVLTSLKVHGKSWTSTDIEQRIT